MNGTGQLSRTVTHEAGRIRIALAGEIDLAVQAELRRWLHEALQAHPAQGIEVDISSLSFVDSAGIREFVDAHNAATGSGIAWRLHGATGAPRLVLKITGVLGTLTSA